MCLRVLRHRKYFLFFLPQNGQEQRFLLLIAVEMRKLPFMGPMVLLMKHAVTTCEYQKQ